MQSNAGAGSCRVISDLALFRCHFSQAQIINSLLAFTFASNSGSGMKDFKGYLDLKMLLHGVSWATTAK